MKTIVTGCAGFIGAATVRTLLKDDKDTTVIGIDNLNDYYDVNLKLARLNPLKQLTSFRFHQLDIKNNVELLNIFAKYKPHAVIHLAAQAGVRYSLQNPTVYVDSNLVGFCNVLEACRQSNIQHLVFASSSSVYGNNTKLPFSERDVVDCPLSLYAASKRANELLAYSYSHLYGLPITGLRYFTAYGPWGRPDMAPFKFMQKILMGKPIQVYNQGHHQRDFTYIDDIAEGTVQILKTFPKKSLSQGSPSTPYRIYNIGYGKPIKLLQFIELLEECLGKKAIKEMLPKQKGDMDITWADTSDLEKKVGYRPKICMEEGVIRLVEWYKNYVNG
ncbi:MAG: hypothetical protein A3E83_08265 [Gammaproteobacteria bacterium RIFCSPHIGHO2_12_FULL_41_20]|nr:MAG: hypothetical protein A3E83_08265 [Gammaproteobacteria bacterium RIFCSPHIGHO2_12_FULL_41_20]